MYGLEIWGDDNYIVKDDTLRLNYKSSPSLYEITKAIRAKGVRGPLLLRFPHLVEKQIDALFGAFSGAIAEHDYRGDFKAVFPLKVNQYANVVESLMRYGEPYGYGLEAGSKAELVIAMAYTKLGAPITVNGFKDAEMITMSFIAAKMGHNITVIIEGLGELESIIEVAQKSAFKVPQIGLRVRLHSSGAGAWAKSGGMDAKFGLTSTELIEAMHLLKRNDLIGNLTMTHFHIGSQMEEIAPLKKALREAGNIYAELKNMGAFALASINIGGGLAVEYAQHESRRIRNYSLEEFANDVVFLIGEIMNAKGVEHPNIFTESGRFIVASHAVLISPVLELFSHDYQEIHLKFKENNPPLITELIELNKLINQDNFIEYMHDALDHIESLLTLFDLGYIDLQDRSNAEILTHQIIKKALYLSAQNPTKELKALQMHLQERYLLNSSFFQSIPDYWGLKQQFPVMPIHHLEKKPIRPASLWDITCDSDGEIAFDFQTPLYLHDIDLDTQEYFLAFFNTGAYQDTLSMMHNLFARPNEATIEMDEHGYTIVDFKESKDILHVIEQVDYDSDAVLEKLKKRIEQNDFNSEQEKFAIVRQLKEYLAQNSYLRTTN